MTSSYNLDKLNSYLSIFWYGFFGPAEGRLLLQLWHGLVTRVRPAGCSAAWRPPPSRERGAASPAEGRFGRAKGGPNVGWTDKYQKDVTSRQRVTDWSWGRPLGRHDGEEVTSFWFCLFYQSIQLPQEDECEAEGKNSAKSPSKDWISNVDSLACREELFQMK